MSENDPTLIYRLELHTDPDGETMKSPELVIGTVLGSKYDPQAAIQLVGRSLLMFAEQLLTSQVDEDEYEDFGPDDDGLCEVCGDVMCSPEEH